MSVEDYQAEGPCQRCGACCAHFRVSFYWSEATACGLPDAVVEQVTPLLACMAGTNQAEPRCQALEGQVGARVGCRLYEQRPAPCREVRPGDDRCNQAREGHGLPPISVS